VSETKTVVLDQRYDYKYLVSPDLLERSTLGAPTVLAYALADAVGKLGNSEKEHPELHFDWRTFRLTVEPETISLNDWGKDVLCVRAAVSAGKPNV